MRVTIEGAPVEGVDGTYEVRDDGIVTLGVESDFTWRGTRGAQDFKAVDVVRRLRVEGVLDDDREEKLRLVEEFTRRARLPWPRA